AIQRVDPRWQSPSLPQWQRRVAIPRTALAPDPNHPADLDRAETEIARRAHALHVACPCLSMPQKCFLRNENFRKRGVAADVRRRVPCEIRNISPPYVGGYKFQAIRDVSALFASNIRFTDSRSKTTSVKTAKTVPKGMNRHSTAAITKQN